MVGMAQIHSRGAEIVDVATSARTRPAGDHRIGADTVDRFRGFRTRFGNECGRAALHRESLTVAGCSLSVPAEPDALALEARSHPSA